MVNGQSRVDYHSGFLHEQLPILPSLNSQVGSAPQSLLEIDDLPNRGDTRYQAVNKLLVNIALGIFCLPFLLNPPLISAQTNTLTNSISTITQSIQPSASPTQSALPTPSPTTNPAPQLPLTDFQLPHPGYITTTFSNYHPGIDICTGLGMPIHPIAKGVVTSAGYNFWGLGLVVEVDHGNGYKSLYAHMGKIYVKEGKEITPNDLLGEVGLTGHTTGPHTHLEISYNNQKVNPQPLLPELRSYPKEEDFTTYQSSTPSAVTIPTISTASNSAQFQNSETTPTAEADNTTKPTTEAKITPEKISENTLNTILSPSSTKTESSISSTLIPLINQFKTTNPPATTNVAFTSELSNILALSTFQPKNDQEKSTFEKIAQQSLTTLLIDPAPQPTASPLPEGGRISFNFGTLLHLQ